MRETDSTGWNWFSTPASTSRTAEDEAEALAGCFTRCFTGIDGARVLAALRAMTTERVLAPDASEAVLRHLEGQRHLVATIQSLIARGHNPHQPFSSLTE
ncbi:conserved hypothetical protein [uncultured Gammaproteobacteria bacterium]